MNLYFLTMTYTRIFTSQNTDISPESLSVIPNQNIDLFSWITLYLRIQGIYHLTWRYAYWLEEL